MGDDFIQRSASRVSVKVEPEPEPQPEPQVTSVPVPVLPKVQPKKINTMATTIRPKNKDKKLLEQYLVNHGNFGGKTSMIESISFGDYNDVAYVRVRGALKTIKNKMKQLNKKKGAVLSIYERRQYNAESRENNVLFVNNFDITDKTVHRRFTNLFLQFGQLVKDIRMGIDKNA